MCQKFKNKTRPDTYKIADANTEQMYLDSSGGEPQVVVYYTSRDQFGTDR